MTNYKIALAMVITMAMAVRDTASFVPAPTFFTSRSGGTNPASSAMETDEFYSPLTPNETNSNIPESSMLTTIVEDAATIPEKAALKVEKSGPNKKASRGTKDGIFSPVVKAAKTVLGDAELNKLRAKVIGEHSKVIGNLVKTSDSPFGQTVLKQLFVLADADKNGTIEEAELEACMYKLGFRFLNEKQVRGIFERADTDQNGRIDMEEWLKEAPKTLRTNLIKLAKKNGGELGFLA